MRGDHAEARRLLQPLADRPEPDALAEFFLAVLAEGHPGSPGDSILACGLYVRSATANNPLAAQASAIADTMRSRNPLMYNLCAAASVRGPRTPSPTSFTLGPEHWVRIETSGFQIGYRGTEARVSTPWGGHGFFLPTRYTKVYVERPTAGERHFVEFVFWEPTVASSSVAWSLIWMVYEVVGAESYLVPGRPDVTTVVGRNPPTSYPIEGIGRMQVNSDGDVERQMLGENRETIVVPFRGLQ